MACGAALAWGDAGLVTAQEAAPRALVTVTNPLPEARFSETVTLRLAELRRVAPALDYRQAVVSDVADAEVLSQLVDMDGDLVPDELVFQRDFSPRQSLTFTVRAGTRRPLAPDAFRVYGRFVRERHDDFAWENDLVAHRVYGPRLEHWPPEPLVSSGIDVWTKRVRKLVVDDWYLTGDYHEDHGEGADLYSVGTSRGCGGLGLFTGKTLAASRNFRDTRVLANGPIRLVFELSYAPWDVGSARVAENRRVTVDAGQHFDRFESTFSSTPAEARLLAGIGIAKHAGSTAELDPRGPWLRSWEPLPPGHGNLGCAVLVPGAKAELATTATDYLLVTPVPASGTVVYFAGFGWDRTAAIADASAWQRLVEQKQRQVSTPLRIVLAAEPLTPGAAIAAPALGYAMTMLRSVMARAPSVLTDRWEYDTGMVLRGIERIAVSARDARALAYVKRTIDGLVGPSGTIAGYRLEDYNIDQINMGRVIFRLWAEAQGPDRERYRQALALLRSQMKSHPRTSDGAFWHKQIYPWQMWLDGVYMAAPFLAEYAATFDEPALFDEVCQQIVLAEMHMRDPSSGLLYHGWDERKTQRWADPLSGRSSQFWARAMGWYAMAIVDVLEWLPEKHARRAAVLAVLRRLATAIESVQDRATGVWWQVLDQAGRPGNYREASASSMFVYALTKAVRRGWLPAMVYGPVAERGYRGLLTEFVEHDRAGQLGLKQVCKVAGLGGTPYRDGSYAYYTSTQVVKNDPKGIGAFLLAAAENE